MTEAAAGRFPPVDGQVVFVPPLKPGLAAVLSLTGRAYIASDLRSSDLDGLPLEGLVPRWRLPFCCAWPAPAVS